MLKKMLKEMHSHPEKLQASTRLAECKKWSLAEHLFSVFFVIVLCLLPAAADKMHLEAKEDKRLVYEGSIWLVYD